MEDSLATIESMRLLLVEARELLKKMREQGFTIETKLEINRLIAKLEPIEVKKGKSE